MFAKRPEQSDLSVGMVVIYEERRGAFNTVDIWATITKITPKGQVTVKWEAYDKLHEKVVRPPYRDIRIPTEGEVAIRDWRRSKPEFNFIKVSRRDTFGYGSRGVNDYHVEFDLYTDQPPEGSTPLAVIAEAIAELETFKNWLAQRPKGSLDVET